MTDLCKRDAVYFLADRLICHVILLLSNLIHNQLNGAESFLRS